MVWKPFQSCTHCCTVDDACSESCQNACPKVKRCQAVGGTCQHPSGATEDPSGYHEEARTKSVDERTRKRNEPSLEQDECAEGYLNGGEVPAKFLVDGIYEERPTVLVVRYGYHADNGS